MTRVLVLLALLVCCICLAIAVPAPAGDAQTVQFLKYTNDKDLEEIQRQIIAQYDHLGGTSQFHEVQAASVLDPATIKINL